MKARITLLSFVLLLLLGTFTGAVAEAPSSAPVDLASSIFAPDGNPSEALPCNERTSAVERAIFASNAETEPQYCGSCSFYGCYGAPRGSMCYLSMQGRWAFCHVYNLTDICTEDGQWRCACMDNDMS